MLIFFAFKRRYRRHWITWWNMFTYFWCKWIFRIIFTYISLFYYTLKILINNKWCILRFFILVKFLYFSVFRRHYNVTKIFIFTYFFLWDSSLCFVLKEWNNLDNKNHHYSLMFFRFFRLVVLGVSLFEIIKRITCFSQFELCFEI